MGTKASDSEQRANAEILFDEVKGLIDQVDSRESFNHFMVKLDQLRRSDPDGSLGTWENAELYTYLKAMYLPLRTDQETNARVADVPSWQNFARMLFLAGMLE